MKNRHVGIIILSVSIVLLAIIYLFNRALTQIVNDSCSHGPTCPMWGSISFHTNLSLILAGIVGLVGLYMIIFSKSDVVTEVKVVKEQVHPKKVDKEHYKNVLSKLDVDEKKIFEKLLDSNGTIFQSELVNEELTKVKVTRILDRLEGQGLIERRRRGMTNVVILKH